MLLGVAEMTSRSVHVEIIASWLQTKPSPSRNFMSVALAAAVISIAAFMQLFSERENSLEPEPGVPKM